MKFIGLIAVCMVPINHGIFFRCLTSADFLQIGTFFGHAAVLILLPDGINASNNDFTI